MHRIVIGTDGSQHATTALRWAVEEAALHGATVEAVLAWSFLDQHRADGSNAFDADYGEDDAQAALSAWVTEAVGPGAAVEQRAVCEVPAQALLERGDDADLLVLGARGTGGFEGLLVGSVSDRVVQLARRPVAVVHAPGPVRGGRVVVGVDGSTQALSALRWAGNEARARDAVLDVVHAWRLHLRSAPPMASVLPDASTLEQSGRELLDAAVADPSLAGIAVQPHLVHGNPAGPLLELARGAGLVLIGSRGLGRVTGGAARLRQPPAAAPLTLSPRCGQLRPPCCDPRTPQPAGASLGLRRPRRRRTVTPPGGGHATPHRLKPVLPEHEARALGRPPNWAAAALAFTVLALLVVLLFVYACTP
jgi:nucleotide-binding universal stress UspA family protein